MEATTTQVDEIIAVTAGIDANFKAARVAEEHGHHRSLMNANDPTPRWLR